MCDVVWCVCIYNMAYWSILYSILITTEVEQWVALSVVCASPDHMSLLSGCTSSYLLLLPLPCTLLHLPLYLPPLPLYPFHFTLLPIPFYLFPSPCTLLASPCTSSPSPCTSSPSPCTLLPLPLYPPPPPLVLSSPSPCSLQAYAIDVLFSTLYTTPLLYVKYTVVSCTNTVPTFRGPIALGFKTATSSSGTSNLVCT